VSDDEFLDTFEAARLPELHHADHIRVAWLYLRREGVATGVRRVVSGIRRFAAAKGATGRYHETLTLPWVRLVAAALREDGGDEIFEEFARAHPHLLRKEYPFAFFRSETLASDAAGSRWIEPDLAPLP
jgi:hypothetical protein